MILFRILMELSLVPVLGNLLNKRLLLVNERQGIDISNTEGSIIGLWSVLKSAFRMQSSNIWCLSGTSGTCVCSGRTGIQYIDYIQSIINTNTIKHWISFFQVVKASSPVHGRISPIHHDGMDIFQSIPSPFNAVRYHSLVVSPQDTPLELAVNAWCNDDRNNDDASSSDSIIMGFRHLSKPIWSVQFHPESICTDFGQIIVNNFCKLVEKHWGYVSSVGGLTIYVFSNHVVSEP